jgi:hypothetical protein
VKFDVLVAVPPGVVTAIGPVLAPLGTVAVSCVDEFPVNFAFVPLNVTAVAPLKFVPVIVTDAPAVPFAGEKDEIVGAAMEPDPGRPGGNLDKHDCTVHGRPCGHAAGTDSSR